MDYIINVEPRALARKKAARKLRANGLIPGIIYGHKEKPRPFSVSPKEVRTQLSHSGRGRNTVLTVKGLDRELFALVKDAQTDPVRRDLIHLDLIEVRETDRVEVEVPIEYTGKAAGVVDGGVLQQLRRSLGVRCKPLEIPEKIEVDVSELHIGMAIHVRDVTLTGDLEHTDPENVALVTVVAPAAEEEPTPAEAAATAEGEAAPAGAEGAAAAPAKEEEKKKAD